MVDTAKLKIIKTIINKHDISLQTLDNGNLIYYLTDKCHLLNINSRKEINPIVDNTVDCPETAKYVDDENGSISVLSNTISRIPPSDPTQGYDGFKITSKQSGQVIARIPPITLLNFMFPSPDGTKIAFFYDNNRSDNIIIWHYNYQPIASISLRGPAYPINSNISADGKLFAIQNYPTNHFQIIDSLTGKKRFETPESFPLGTKSTFSWDGKYLVTGCFPTYEIYDVDTGKKVFSKQGHGDNCCLKAIPNNQILTGSSGSVIDVLSGKQTSYNLSDVCSPLSETNQILTYNTPSHSIIINGDNFVVTNNKISGRKLTGQLCEDERLNGLTADKRSLSILRMPCGYIYSTEIYDIATLKMTGLALNEFYYSPGDKFVVWFNIDRLEIWPADPTTWPLEVIYSPVHFTEKDRCKDDGFECP